MIDRPIRYTPSAEETPTGDCECGCGQRTPIAESTLRKYRWFKGHPKPFVPGHHARVTPRRPSVKQHTSQFDTILAVAQAAYFAGIIDGEGHLQIRDRSFRVVVGNTDAALIEWLTSFGGKSDKRSSPAEYKQMYVWYVGTRAAVANLLRQTIPYMIVKKERAEAILSMIDHMGNYGHDDIPTGYIPTDQILL